LQPVSHSLMSSILTQRTQLTGTTCHLLHFLELIMIISTQCYLDVTYFQRKTKTLYIWFGAMIATYVSSCFKSNYYYNQCPAIQDAVKEEFPNSHHCHFLWHIMKKNPWETWSIRTIQSNKEDAEESRVWNYEFIEIFEFEETWSRMVKDYNLWSNYRKAHSIEIIKLGLRNCWINSIFKLFKLFAVVWYYL
jgi:hypothetical protein